MKVVVSATMASRFADVDENGIRDLVVSSENKNTRKYELLGTCILEVGSSKGSQRRRAKYFALDVINM